MQCSMKFLLKLVLTNSIDTGVETNVIKESEDAEALKKRMHEINAINQQVLTVLFLTDPQKDLVIKILPDFPCIEFALRILDIRKWQKTILRLVASFVENKHPTIEDIREAIK